MDARFKVLLVGKNKGFIEQFSSTLHKEFHVVVAAEAADASTCVAKSAGDIAVVILNITDDLDQDPIELIKSIRHTYHPEIILSVNPAELRSHDVSHVVKLVRYGAGKILELPSFSEEILLFCRKAAADYRNQAQFLNNFVSDPGRKLAFFDFLDARKEMGLPVLLKEMELFFPINKTDILPVKHILEALKNPPVDDFKAITVLIVEDEHYKIEEYKRFLQRFGYNILCAKSSTEAEKTMKASSSIDVVILDIGLDDGTAGNDLVPLIKHKHPLAEIIMLTAWERFDLIVSCLKNGAFDYLIKTKTDMDILSQKVLQALHKKTFDQMVAHHLKQAGEKKPSYERH